MVKEGRGLRGQGEEGMKKGIRQGGGGLVDEMIDGLDEDGGGRGGWGEGGLCMRDEEGRGQGRGLKKGGG